jgi:hypothetical protein
MRVYTLSVYLTYKILREYHMKLKIKIENQKLQNSKQEK